MDRILSREAEALEAYTTLDKIKIGIVGISSGVGVSFVVTSMARYLSNTRKYSPAVVELGKDSIFDSIGMDKRFAGREYFSFCKAIKEGRNIRGSKNMDEGINWILRCPEDNCEDINIVQKLRLINGAMGDIILCDLSGCDKDYLQLLEHMDQIIVVIDPLPSKMLVGYLMLQKLKALNEAGHSIIYVVNKYNRGVNHRQMLDFLKLKKLIYLPMINIESIYTAEYICKIPYSLGDIKSQLQDPIKEIIGRLKI